MGRRDVLIAVALGLVTLALRLVFAAHQPTEWDSVHYIRALDHFNVVQYWPHAPGYWLYVFIGRVIRATMPLGGLGSLLLATALASAATVSITYLLALDVADRCTAFICAAVMLTQPFAWFYGSIVTTKSYDSFVFVLLLWLAYRARPGSRLGVVACVVLGLAGGVRQSAAVMFAPLLIYILVRTIRSFRHLVVCGVAGALAVAAWFVPMILEQPGGLGPIRAQSNLLLVGSLHETSFLVGSAGARANALQVIGVALTSVLPLLPLAAIGLAGLVILRRDGARTTTVWLPLLLATVPGVLEAFAVHFGTPGYSLTFLPGLLLALLLPLRTVVRRSGWAAVAVALTVIICAYQAERFALAPTVLPTRVAQISHVWANGAYGAPYNETFKGLRATDADQVRYRAIRQVFDPSRDVLVYADLNGNYRYRLAGYQLPEFTLHLETGGIDIDQARAGRHTTNYSRTISIPPGGSAVLVLDFLPDELKHLVETGQLRAVTLSTGPTVYALEPGTTAYSISFVTGPLPKI